MPPIQTVLIMKLLHLITLSPIPEKRWELLWIKENYSLEEKWQKRTEWDHYIAITRDCTETYFVESDSSKPDLGLPHRLDPLIRLAFYFILRSSHNLPASVTGKYVGWWVKDQIP